MPTSSPHSPAPEKPGRSSWLSIFLTAILLGVVGLILLVLSLGQLLPVLVIGGLIFLVTAFHYLVWGWWLGRMIQREAEEEELEV